MLQIKKGEHRTGGISDEGIMLNFSLTKLSKENLTICDQKINIIIRCPGKKKKRTNNGQFKEKLCLSTKYIKKGKDRKLFAEPQRYKCKKCGRKFYAHTSAFFEIEATNVVKQILKGIHIDHQKNHLSAMDSHYSDSNITAISNQFREYINDQLLKSAFILSDQIENLKSVIPLFDISFQEQLGILTEIDNQVRILPQSPGEFIWEVDFDISGEIVICTQSIAALKSQNSLRELDYSKMMILDETFLMIGGRIFYLIIAVSKEGKLLSWALSRSRSAEILNKVFLSALDHYPFPGIVVTDGFGAYKTMLNSYHHPIIHISHIHKPPYGRVVITQRSYFPKFNKFYEYEIGLFSDIFASSGQKPIYFQVKEKPIQISKKPRGRPKGSKNRTKEEIQKEKSERAHQPKKKRGRKSIYKTGKLNFVDVDLETNSISIDNDDNDFLSMQILILLSVLLPHFKGKHITSNYVENFFSQLKYFFSRGRKTNVLNFLDAFQVYIVRYQGRVLNKKLLEDLIDQYLEKNPPPPGFGWRDFFQQSLVPFICS